MLLKISGSNFKRVHEVLINGNSSGKHVLITMLAMPKGTLLNVFFGIYIKKKRKNRV